MMKEVAHVGLRRMNIKTKPIAIHPSPRRKEATPNQNKHGGMHEALAELGRRAFDKKASCPNRDA